MYTKTIKINDKEYAVNCFEENGKTVVELPEELKKLDGYGTALKPAYEPVVLCRKPKGKETFVDCALNYGTGSLNIDNTRIETTEDTRRNAVGGENGLNGSDTFKIRQRFVNEQIKYGGRFPANLGLICDCEKEPCECIERELDNQSGASKSIGGGGLKSPVWTESIPENMKKDYGETTGFNDVGGASRFFYTAKSSRKERNLGLDTQNNHPTVKPIKLIEYLATMLKPPVDDSSILIPFSGSGSEIIGAMFAGWNNITGVEIDSDYVGIADERIKYWSKFDSYEKAMKK